MDGRTCRRRSWREAKACVTRVLRLGVATPTFIAIPPWETTCTGHVQLRGPITWPPRRDRRASCTRVGRRRRRGKWLGGAKTARFLDISGVSYCRVRGSFRTFIRSNFWTRLGSVTRTGKVVGNARDTFTCRGPGYGIDDPSSGAFSRGFRRLGLPFTCHVREHRFEMEWDNNATLREKREIVISVSGGKLFFKLNLIHYCIFLFILFIYFFFYF